jgi:sporulation protein YlmC with PRC-barrel domain
MDISSATEIARVLTPIVDPAEHRVVGFRVDGSSPVLPWEGIHAVGADALTVDGPSAIRQGSTDAEVRATSVPIDPIGLRVLDEDGLELGTVDDIEFDPATGTITEILVAGASHPGDELLGIGDYAVVLRASTAIPQ